MPRLNISRFEALILWSAVNAWLQRKGYKQKPSDEVQFLAALERRLRPLAEEVKLLVALEQRLRPLVLGVEKKP